MPRPRLRRLVCSEPDTTYFKPAGVRIVDLEESVLNVEEFEAIRLKDLEEIEQDKAAEKMGISQPTFHRLISSARKKIADAIINGKARVVYGSRFLSEKQRKKNYLFLRKHPSASFFAFMGGRIITITTNILFDTGITDEPTCYKVFSSSVIKNMRINGNRFDWEPEVTAKIAKRGIRIREVPISYDPRTAEDGKKINWKDGIQAIWTLVKYRFVD